MHVPLFQHFSALLLHATVTYSLLLAGGSAAYAKEEHSSKKHEARTPATQGQQSLPGLNLEAFLSGVKIEKGHVDLEVRKGEVTGYQTTPEKALAFINVREAFQYIHQGGLRYFVFDITDTVSGKSLSVKATRVSSPNPTTLRLTGLTSKDKKALRDLLGRLKTADPHRPRVPSQVPLPRAVLDPPTP